MVSIEPSEVGITGLLWLFFSYGYALYYASNLIGEGSELLLLVPSMAGLVGGVVLPLLGAVPDGAIILFSGLGDIETAQETLSVGVGALAGSTIMLLTVPWAMSIYAGRVDLNGDGKPDYMGKPKLSTFPSLGQDLKNTGVTLSLAVRHGGVIMAATTLPYFLIQVPAAFLHGPTEEVAEGEHWWALLGFVVCLSGLAYYMRLQLQFSREGQDKDRRVAAIKKALSNGKISLSGALHSTIQKQKQQQQQQSASAGAGTGEYQSLTSPASQSTFSSPPPEAFSYLSDILGDAFKAYDTDRSGKLEVLEIRLFFKDFHENISEAEMDRMFKKADRDRDGGVSFDEFIALAYNLITSNHQLEAAAKNKEKPDRESLAEGGAHRALVENIMSTSEDEEEEVPEDFTDLSPDEQQVAIKWRAFKMLALGTAMVIYFSDPMVDVMQDIAIRCNLSPFYVSFILAPLASNASEVIASQYYASKKTRKTITVSLSALEGAASMNNTFCLSIFMGLIFFRGLAWQYTAETIAIVVVEVIMAFLVQSDVMTTARAMLIFCLFPLSLVLVGTLEHFGFD